MASLVAGFGYAGGDRRGDGVNGEILSLGVWEDPAARVRLGVVTAKSDLRAQVRATNELVVAAVGRFDGVDDGVAALLDAYGRRRVAGLSGLHGDYAYALWDRAARSLIVGCDAVGLRAPAYTWDGRVFRAGSRAIELLGHSGRPPAWDEAYVAHTLSGLWCRTASATAFHGVRRMVGGEILRVSDRGLDRLVGSQLSFSGSPIVDRGLAVRELGDAVDQAVAEMAGATPSCVAVSGGVDSCVVATALANHRGGFDAFSLVAPPGSPGHDPALAGVISALRRVRHHLVPFTGPDPTSNDSAPLPDDPICAGPALQPAREALFRAVRDAGFKQVLDGDGGDELFDIVWRPADLFRQMALVPLLAVPVSSGLRRRFLRDLGESGRGPVSDWFLERARWRVRATRPWLRKAFWEGSSFAFAWSEAVSLGRLPTPRARLPEVVGAYGRHWRHQDLARRSAGLEGASPLLDRRVVELVGSVRASAAMDLRHSKALLRRLANQRVPTAVAWRPKREPLSDWLVQRWVSEDANLDRTLTRIENSRLLVELIDAATLKAAVHEARKVPGPNSLATSIVELGALIQWMTAAAAQFGL